MLSAFHVSVTACDSLFELVSDSGNKLTVGCTSVHNDEALLLLSTSVMNHLCPWTTHHYSGCNGACLAFVNRVLLT